MEFLQADIRSIVEQYARPAIFTIHFTYNAVIGGYAHVNKVDSMTGEVLARAADKQKPEYANVADVDDEGGLIRAEAAAKYWAALFRDFLDRNFSK